MNISDTTMFVYETAKCKWNLEIMWFCLKCRVYLTDNDMHMKAKSI